VQGDLIQRRLFTVHFHVYASTEYLKRFGQPERLSDLDNHRIMSFGGPVPHYLLAVHWLATAGRDARDPRSYHLLVNNVTSLKKAVEKGAGIAVLPDFIVEQGLGLVQLLSDVEMPSLDSYLVFPEEMKNVARVQVFRDFLIGKAQRWTY
jgi:DNA-binding transcriptional LysR family regulator